MADYFLVTRGDKGEGRIRQLPPAKLLEWITESDGELAWRPFEADEAFPGGGHGVGRRPLPDHQGRGRDADPEGLDPSLILG